MKYFNKLCLFFLVVFSCDAQNYQLHCDSKTKYISQDEKNKLFELVGCQYLNAIKINVLNFDKIDSTNRQYYLAYYTVNQIRENQELLKRYDDQVVNYHLAPVYVQWISLEIGYGLFAKQKIFKDDFIGVYAGELRLLPNIANIVPEDLDYAWVYPITAPNGKYLVIDAKFMSNELRFVNHAVKPNTRGIDFLINGLFYKCYIATQDIEQDFEITTDYGVGYWDARKGN